jgi:preprotein translocase subunit SecD
VKRLRTFARMASLALLALLVLAGCGAQGATSSGQFNVLPQDAASPQASVAPQDAASPTPTGGLLITVQMLCPTNQPCDASAASQMISALQQRARGLGVSGASVKQLDATRFVVSLPGYSNQKDGVAALSAQGIIHFIDTGTMPLTIGAKVSAKQYPTLFTGAEVDPSTISVGTQSGSPYVVFGFSSAAAPRFAQYTSSHVGEYLTITLDGKVIISATIQSEISGLAEVSYGETLEDASVLAACLKSAPLPYPVKLISVTLAPGAK